MEGRVQEPMRDWSYGPQLWLRPDWGEQRADSRVFWVLLGMVALRLLSALDVSVF